MGLEGRLKPGKVIADNQQEALYLNQFILRLGGNKRVEGVHREYMTEEAPISNNTAE